IAPYLAPLSQGVRDFGDAPDAAHVVKVCGNYLIGAAIQAMGEAFTLAEKSGVSRQDTFAFLTDTVFNCAIYKNYGKQIAPEVYEPAGFPLPLALKDMTLAQALGDETQTPLPFVGVLRAGLTAAIAKGRAHHDFAGLAREASENAGLSPEREIK
ncbi:MAG: NAD(P)-dependent oxidoreductase, partial [Armatimonadetes bacterium]|nr:NAD(P)-dependent oxidoreductase [Armatimonadota bacterium]